ncbi:MAG: Fur family transcriptional regulator [Alphaproteobacteria bacterium]|jgi:Fur family ferric uptake transcriptional regulator
MASSIEKKCIEKGLKMTDQRRIIAKVIASAEDHPNVEQVYDRAVKIDKNISIPTVYRTVKLLEEHGIIEKHDFGDGKARYEESGHEHHDHMVNIRTGEIIEFVNDEIEKLQAKIASQHGYKLVGHKLELYVVPKGVLD